MRILLCLILVIFISSCKSDLELSMERGIQLYEWNKIDESLLEFKFVVNQLWPKYRDGNLSTYEHRLLARAYYNLGVGFAKLEDWSNAEQHFAIAHDIVPETEYRNALKKISLKKNSQKN